jgi:type IV secretory pathway VirB2 component (pilin)
LSLSAVPDSFFGRKEQEVLMEKVKKIARWAVPAALLLPLIAFAVEVPGTNLPGGTELTLTKIKDIIQTVANWLIIVGVIIAVIYIIWGGVSYMAARGDAAKAKTATEHIKNGVIGAAIVLGVGVILRTVAALVVRTFFGAGQ